MKKNDALLLVFIYLIFSFITAATYSGGELKVDVWDVGQGDSIFITTPNGKHILIDGGDNFEADYKLSNKVPYYACYLDLVVLTHPHYDHLYGLNRILKRCKVGTLMFNDVSFSSPQFEDFKEIAVGLNVKNVYAGDNFELDNVNLKILWPSKDFLQNEIADINDVSIVILLDYGDFEMLLTGDATEKVLGNINYDEIKTHTQGDFDVLKVPHHGSKYSLHSGFYSQLEPSMCLISVGEGNKFGHPSPAVIKYFEDTGCKVFRTDLDGDIKIKVR